MTDQPPSAPRCPSCFRNENVRPLSVGLVGSHPQTVEWECSACARVFKEKPKQSGYLNREVTS